MSLWTQFTDLGFIDFLWCFNFFVTIKEIPLSVISTLFISKRSRVWPRSEEDKAIRAMVFKVSCFSESDDAGCHLDKKFRTFATGQYVRISFQLRSSIMKILKQTTNNRVFP